MIYENGRIIFAMDKNFINTLFSIEPINLNTLFNIEPKNLNISFNIDVPDIDFLVAFDTKNNNKLKLPPSIFPSGCVCGHLHEFRKINFNSKLISPCEKHKININPVNIKLRSDK